MSCLLQNIAWHDLWTALALVLILEGMMPFISPTQWRKMMDQFVKQPDVLIRKIGFFVMFIGVLMLYWIRQHMGC